MSDTALPHPLAIGALSDPFPHYARLRDEAPLHRFDATPENSMLPFGSIWLVTRYDDALTILRDHRRFVMSPLAALPPEVLQALPPMPLFASVANESMLMHDPPDHTRLRGLVSRAFTPDVIRRMEPRVHAITDRLIDAFVDRKETELMGSFAFSLPLEVICDMLGMPAEGRENFRRWSDDFSLMPRSSEEIARSDESTRSFLEYIGEFIDSRRRQPQDDLTTLLIQAEEGGERLSRAELQTMLIMLIIAGHETTAMLIGNGIAEVLARPELWERVLVEPELSAGLVEELLRCTSSASLAGRFAAEDVELHGQTIRRGDYVQVLLQSANRDPSRFARPETIDPTREDKGHLGFGFGIHFCLGAPLARMETRIAIAALARRLPGLRLAVPVEELRWEFRPPLRGLRTLPLKWT